MKTYYKVVSKSLNSVVARKGYLGVTYKIGKFVEPKIKGTGLLVFDDLDDAKMFSRGFDRIFECVCENELLLPTRPCTGFFFGFVALKDILNCWGGIRYNNDVAKWPTGTRAFQRVKLIKEIL